MELDEMSKLAEQVRAAYAARNVNQGRTAWTGVDYTMGLVGDVGDLFKLVQAKYDLRSYDGQDLDAALVHELNDCLWSILTIANVLNVDLPGTFEVEMGKLLARVTGQPPPDTTTTPRALNDNRPDTD